MNLSDVLSSVNVRSGELAICWLGQAGVFLKDGKGNTLTLDPYLTNCGERIRGFKRLSAMLIDPVEFTPDYHITTHLHFDHFDYDAIPVIARNSPQTLFMGPSSCITKFHEAGIPAERCCRLDRGDVYRDTAITVQAILADHGTMAPDAIGVMLEMGGHRLYFSGDTAFHAELFQKVAEFKPDIVFLSINGQFGNLNEVEGAQAAAIIGAPYAVPCHCWTFMEHQGNPYVFCEQLRQISQTQVFFFRQGEVQVLDVDNQLREMEGGNCYESDSLYATRSH